MPLPPPPPPPPTSRVAQARMAAQRRRARLLGGTIALLLVVGVGAVLGWEATEDGPPHPDRWNPRVADLAAYVERARGLDFEHPVEVDFLTPEEYSDVATADVGDLDEETVEALDAGAAELRALGVVSGELDLAEAANQVTDAGTLAFYDPADQRIRVRGTDVTIGMRVTLVHELVHALQDQHFDLEDLLTEDTVDEVPTRRAVAEGDAVRIEQGYVADELSDAERDAYDAEFAAELDRSLAGTSAVPDFLSATFAVPYQLGHSLVGLLAVTDGNGGVDELFTDPPTTEEHLFDPASYLAGEEADRPGLGLPDDDVDDAGTLGSPSWYLVLAQRIDPGQAFAAALGWGGDDYARYERDGRTCVRAVFDGDTEADEREMAGALDAWVAALPDGQAEARQVRGHPAVDACDPGPDVDLGVRDISSDLLALPVNLGAVQSEVAAFLTPAETRCFSRTLLEDISYDRLLDPADQDALVEEIQAKAPEARQRCGSGDR